MDSGDFIKDRYIFSSKKNKKEVNEKILEKQVQFYTRALKAYKVSMKNLACEYPSQDDRNLILNIAYYIVSDERILKNMKNNRKISLEKVKDATDIPMEFLNSWKDYITAYVLLLYTDKYLNIYNYLNTTFKELEVLSVITSTGDEGVIFKGIVVATQKKTSIILTNNGEFIRINNASDKLGKEISGKEKKTFRHYKNIVFTVAILTICMLGFFYYNYSKDTTTLVIQSTSQIKMSINKYNRVTYAYSPTEKGERLVIGLDSKNKNIDDVMLEMFKKFKEMNMVPESKKIEIVVTGEKLTDDKIPGLLGYIEELKSDDDYSNNISIIINNVGYEKYK